MLSFILLVLFGVPAVLAWKNYIKRETPSHLFIAILLSALAVFLGFAALTKLLAGTMMLVVIVFGLVFVGTLAAYLIHKAYG
tara:strand:- start:1876 stop:2121 length:246 start_codon:yes stop_codon:yes gene_type:complete